MKTKSTKRALLSAILALVMTVSMLVGTTFAWFTDSVTSANNIIVAGNLDAALYYQNDEVTSWTAMDENTNVFKADTKWEPGHVEVVKLKVANLGSLDFKYELGINIASETGSVNMAGTAFKLSEYIWYGVTEENVTDRASAIAAVSASAKQIKSGTTVPATLAAPTATTPSEKVITLVVYMPETVGNEANYGKDQVAPQINLGITLVATQLGAELDSFGPDYDSAAPMPETIFGTVAGEDTTLKASNEKLSVTVPEEAGDGKYTLKVTNTNEETNAAGETSVSFDLALEKDGVAVTEQPGVEYTVELDIGKDLLISKVLHKGVEVTNYSYDGATGILSFTTSSFSPFEIVFKEIAADAHKVVSADGSVNYYTLPEIPAKAKDGDVITLRSDVALEETLVIDKNVTLDLNEKTVSGQLTTLLKLAGGTVVIKNGALKNEHEAAAETKYSVYMCGDAVAEIKDVEIVTSGTGIYMTENAKITELDAEVDSYMTTNGYCVFNAVSLVDNARIDKISGGCYEARYSDAFLEGMKISYSYSGMQSYAVDLNSADSSIGEIAGGEFYNIADKMNNGGPIHVNSGKVELISGGYFGFSKMSLTTPYFSMFVYTSNGGSIEKITGGKFEKPTGSFKCDIEGIADKFGYQLVETGETVDVIYRMSTKDATYTLKILEVVAK